jgi:hypothetical protein
MRPSPGQSVRVVVWTAQGVHELRDCRCRCATELAGEGALRLRLQTALAGALCSGKPVGVMAAQRKAPPRRGSERAR